MPTDPAASTLMKLEELEKELEFIAVPTANGDKTLANSYKSKDLKAELTPITKTISEIIKITFKTAGGQNVSKEISDALKQVANTFWDLGDKLDLGKADLEKLAGNDVTKAVKIIRQALITAQTLIPGGSSFLASGSDAFNQLDSILELATKDINGARIILYKLAQKFAAIATAINPA